MSETREQFTKIVKFINSNDFKLHKVHKQHIRELIIKWNKKDKTTQDYYDMKNNHMYLNGGLSKYSSELDEMWMEYIKLGMTMRLSSMISNFKR